MAKNKKKEFLKRLLNRFSTYDDDDTDVQYGALVEQSTSFENQNKNATTAIEEIFPTSTELKYAIAEANTTTPQYNLISDYVTENAEVTTILENLYFGNHTNTNPPLRLNATMNDTINTTIEESIVAETMATANYPMMGKNVHFEEITMKNNSIRQALNDKRRHFSLWKFHERVHSYKNKLRSLKLEWWAFGLICVIILFILFLLSFVIKKFNEYRLQERLEALDNKAKSCPVQFHSSVETDSESPRKCMGNQPVTQNKNEQFGISFVFSKDDNKKTDNEPNSTTNAITSKAVTNSLTSQCYSSKGATTRKFNAQPKTGNIIDPLNLEKTTVIKYGAVEINYNVRKQENTFQKMSPIIPRDDDMESSTESEDSHSNMEKHLVPKKEHHALNVPGSTDGGPHNTHPTPRHDKSEEHVENEVSNVRFVEYTHIQNKIHANMNNLVIRDDSENTVHFDDIALAETEAQIDKPSSSTKTAEEIKQAQSLKSLLSERCDSSVSSHLHNEHKIVNDHFKTFMDNIEEAGINANIQVDEYIDKIEVVDSDTELEKVPERLDFDKVKNKNDNIIGKDKVSDNSSGTETVVIEEVDKLTQAKQPQKTDKESTDDDSKK